MRGKPNKLCSSFQRDRNFRRLLITGDLMMCILSAEEGEETNEGGEGSLCSVPFPGKRAKGSKYMRRQRCVNGCKTENCHRCWLQGIKPGDCLCRLTALVILQYRLPIEYQLHQIHSTAHHKIRQPEGFESSEAFVLHIVSAGRKLSVMMTTCLNGSLHEHFAQKLFSTDAQQEAIGFCCVWGRSFELSEAPART